MSESLTKDVVRIRADEIRDGKLFRRCPSCQETKEINEFGLCRMSRAADSGADVIVTHSLCHTCQGDAAADMPNTWAVIVRIACEELREGLVYRKCPKCGEVRELNDFGLRRMVGAGKGATDVIAAQAWCRPCRNATPHDAVAS